LCSSQLAKAQQTNSRICTIPCSQHANLLYHGWSIAPQCANHSCSILPQIEPRSGTIQTLSSHQAARSPSLRTSLTLQTRQHSSGHSAIVGNYPDNHHGCSRSHCSTRSTSHHWSKGSSSPPLLVLTDHMSSRIQPSHLPPCQRRVCCLRMYPVGNSLFPPRPKKGLIPMVAQVMARRSWSCQWKSCQ